MICITIKTSDDYLDSMEDLKTRVFVGGELVENITQHPTTKTVVEAMALTYELANDPEYEDVMGAESELIGEKINRNLRIIRSREDLYKRQQMAKLGAQKLGTCNYRCPGCDVMSALAATTYEMDDDLGTDYNEKFIDYVKNAQREDLAVTGALTCVKGDRSKRPAEGDPDMYVHVVEEKDGGIVVRGSKICQSGCYGGHENLFMPTIALREGEEDYAVSFALPNHTEGVTYIAQYNPYTNERVMEDKEYIGNPDYGVRETSMIVLDDVFVPWERVFMCRERKYAGRLVDRFARMHRMNCGGACKVGFSDLVIGATRIMAKQLGIENALHVREKLLNMVVDSELAAACAVASAWEGIEEPEGSGIYFPDPIYGNASKLHIAEGFWRILQYAGDIVGGFGVCMPSEKELENPETEDFVKKYLKAASSAEERMRLAKFIQNWTAGLHGVGTWHGAGSTEMQKISLYRVYDFEEREKLARDLSGLDEIEGNSD